MPVPGWWPDKLRPRSKAKPGASAASSPRKSVDLDYPSPSPTPRAREKTRSLDSPAARHGGGRCCGGDMQYKLPLPASDPDPETLAEEATGAAAAPGDGCSSSVSGSSVCSSSPDDAPDHHVSSRSMDPVAFAKGRNMSSDSPMILNEDSHFMSRSMPREHQKFFEVPFSNVRELNLHNDDPSTSESSCSRGRVWCEDIFDPRTRSPSPGRKGHTFAMNNVQSREFGFSPRSPLKMMDGLRSPPHPLPLPPAPSACSPLPPSPTSCSPLSPSPTACSPLTTSPTPCLQFQSQWRKGKLLGSGTFGQVYLGFNRLMTPFQFTLSMFLGAQFTSYLGSMALSRNQ